MLSTRGAYDATRSVGIGTVAPDEDVGCSDVGASHACNENVWPTSENTSDITLLARARRKEDHNVAVEVEAHEVAREGSRTRGMRGREVTAMWLKRQTTLGPADCPRCDLIATPHEPIPCRQKQSDAEQCKKITCTRCTHLASPRLARVYNLQVILCPCGKPAGFGSTFGVTTTWGLCAAC